MINNNLRTKLSTLAKILKSYNSLAIALSGGIDSVFLLTFAKGILKNSDNILAITAKSIIHYDSDLEDAIRSTKQLGVRHLFFNSKEIYLDEFMINGENRCYICKKNILQSMRIMALKNGFTTVVHGANFDDVDDYYPGLKAASEIGILAPLIEANFSKKDIRYISRVYGIDIWNKPATACAATRFPRGTRINLKHIEQIKRAEITLSNIGFELCRVRHHGDVARIEISMSQAIHLVDPRISKKVVKAFRKIGYNHVLLDLEGYKRGNMNH